MAARHSTILYEVARKTVLEYAKMAETGDAPPEAFISGCCGLRLHQKTDWNVRIEFPARDCTPWELNRAHLKDLSQNFRIDLAAFSKDTIGDKRIEMLVEFKLWTDYCKVKSDINRLRELSKIIALKEPRPEAYVVSLPHYESLQRVSDAISYFAKRFKLVEYSECPPQAFLTTERVDGPAAGVVIIDVNDSGLAE